MQEPSLYVGIDLGTSNSAAAVFDGSEVAVIRNAQGSALTPSVVRIDARGNVLVGARARRFLDVDPANTQTEFKRLMGTENRFEFPAHAVQRRPEELAAEVLRSLRSDIANQTGIAPECAVISVPALFELHQTAATAEAARLAGFSRIELIQEPVASAIAAGWSQEVSDGPWLVYDLGGGTFDVSLLDSREGLLRVVAHDGDNFLGGRDFDRLLLDLILRQLAADGIQLDRSNPAHALPLRRLRFAAEEAKIELTRAETVPFFMAGLEIDGHQRDIDVELRRTDYENVIEPLIDRSLQLCLQLLAANGIDASGLERLVLIGGPTMTPLLRAKAQALFNVGTGAKLDPMTLVAQGAALFAATVGCDGRPAPSTKTPVAAGPQVWLQFPAMTADLTPYVVGKLLTDTGTFKAIMLQREDGLWQSEEEPVGADGSFALTVSLLPRQNSSFSIFGIDAGGGRHQLRPVTFSIAHGVTLGEPPLARSIGIALADNGVQIFFERGAPLPIRRSFTLLTAETVIAGAEGYALKVPIVQGEFSNAHLCRLVGTLEIPGSALERSLPVSSEIDIVIELDRGGQLRASARIAMVDQVFSEVALLVTPQLAPDEMEAAVRKLEARAEHLSRRAFLDRAPAEVSRLAQVMARLDAIRQHAAAWRGGDLDAGEQLRRALLDADALLAEFETEQAWPELAERLEQRYGEAMSWAAEFATPSERSLLDKAYQTAQRALAAKQADEVERQLTLIARLGQAAFFRYPRAWEQQFIYAAAQLGDCTDIRRAHELVARGRELLQQNRGSELEPVVRELWELAPIDHEAQILGHGSGVRRR